MRKTKAERVENLINQKAITMIALIVTIAVLLILAGISIGVLTGQNGLIKNARKCKRTNRNSK